MGISMKSTSGKILASVALVGTAAAVAGLGTFGEFSDSTTADQTVTAGTVNIDLTHPSTLVTPVTGMLPGDKVEKLFKLSNTSTSNLSSLKLTTTGTGSLLETEPAGLMISIETCAQDWTVVAGAADTCGLGYASIVSTTAVIMSALPLEGLSSINTGGTDYLKITTSLPLEAPNKLQNESSTITLQFDAAQRTGTTS